MVLVAIFAFASPKLGKIRTPRTGESGIGGRSKEAQTNKQLIIRNISRRRERQKVDSKSRFDVLSAYLHQPYFKVLARNAGLVLHFGTVIIDGVYGITEEFCNLRTVVDAQTNQGENAEFRI